METAFEPPNTPMNEENAKIMVGLFNPKAGTKMEICISHGGTESRRKSKTKAFMVTPKTPSF